MSTTRVDRVENRVSMLENKVEEHSKEIDLFHTLKQSTSILKNKVQEHSKEIDLFRTFKHSTNAHLQQNIGRVDAIEKQQVSVVDELKLIREDIVDLTKLAAKFMGGMKTALILLAAFWAAFQLFLQYGIYGDF